MYTVYMTRKTIASIGLAIIASVSMSACDSTTTNTPSPTDGMSTAPITPDMGYWVETKDPSTTTDDEVLYGTYDKMPTDAHKITTEQAMAIYGAPVDPPSDTPLADEPQTEPARTKPPTKAEQVAPTTSVPTTELQALIGDDNKDGRIDEDESGWKCATMGNKVCGPNAPAYMR